MNQDLLTPPFSCVSQAWQQYEHDVYRYLLKHSKTEALAQDLLQETFMKAMLAGSKFCQLDSPKTWLLKVAHNCFIDELRRQKTTVEVTDDIEVKDNADQAPITELTACIQRNLPYLTEADRTVIEQCDLNHVKQADFAKQNNTTVDAVKSRLKRARQKLRALITQHCQVQYDEQGKVCCHKSTLL